MSDEQIPAGGAGADTGAADAPRVAPGERAPIQNVSSQNDIPGVGTRAGDGDMEPEPRRARDASRPAAAQPVDAGTRRDRGRGDMRGAKPAWWLIPAALLGTVCVVFFAVSIPTAGWVAWAGIVLEVILFAALVAVALTMPLGRSRSLVFAGLLGAMAVGGVGIMLTVYALSASA